MTSLIRFCGVLQIAGTLSVGGCTGHLVTKPLAPNATEYDGIVFYPTKLVLEVSKTTTQVDTDGKVIGWAVDTKHPCTPIELERLVVRADYKHPQVLSYQHGILEAYKFGAELNADGSLKSVNIEGTPDRGETIKNLASAATSFLPTGASAPHLVDAAHPACNAGEAVTGLKPYTGSY